MSQENIDNLNKAYHARSFAELNLATAQTRLEDAQKDMDKANRAVAYWYAIVYPKLAKNTFPIPEIKRLSMFDGFPE